MYVQTIGISAITVSGDVVGEYLMPSYRSGDYVDGSPGRDVRLSMPSGMASRNKTLVIAESGTHMVRLYDTENDIATSLAGVYGSPGSGEGSSPLSKSCLHDPRGVAVSPDGRYVYVASEEDNERGGGHINRVDLQKNRVENVLAGTWARRYHHVTADGDGNLIVSYLGDPPLLWKAAVDEGDPKRSTLSHMFPSNPRAVISPRGVAVHPKDGGMSVASDLGRCIYHFTRDGGEFDQQKKVGDCLSSGLDDGDPNEARFKGISSMLWSPGGEVLFIADSMSHRIRYAPYDLSFVGTLAGNGRLGNDAGDGETATITHPHGLALVDNKLYFSQQTSYNIRSIGRFSDSDSFVGLVA